MVWNAVNSSGGGTLMNLLVTGGAGFIGSNLIRHIIHRPEIAKLVNLDCLTYAGHLESLHDVVRNPKFVFEQIDLRDKAAVAQVLRSHSIDRVIHLAAESHVDRSIAVPEEFVQTNIVGTFNLLEAVRQHSADSFVLNASTNKDTVTDFASGSDRLTFHELALGNNH
jgi:dTDP-glucose 4,6-dehydratase